MRKLGEALYGRMAAYEKPLRDAVRRTGRGLARNVYAEAEAEHAPDLARYALTTRAALATQSFNDVLARPACRFGGRGSAILDPAGRGRAAGNRRNRSHLDEEDADLIEDGKIDLGQYAVEQLALSLDPFPRKPGAEFVQPEEPRRSRLSPR
ncbi:Ubiquinol-cytochrome C chaperone [Pyrenophora tritici-repentis]|nr:Ubiquinol-cytochrome C chaperone [Pyrenophora tritici-repentis]